MPFILITQRKTKKSLDMVFLQFYVFYQKPQYQAKPAFTKPMMPVATIL